MSIDLSIADFMRQLILRERKVMELFDILNYNYQWLIRFCEKNGIDIPDRERVHRSWSRVRDVIDDLSPPENKQPKKSPDDRTEP